MRAPRAIVVMSNYPKEEGSGAGKGWSDFQIWRVDYTSGPSEYWVVGGFVGGRAEVYSSHTVLDHAFAARAGMGQGIGAG